MSAYYKIGDFAKEIGVSIQTLRNWDKDGKLKPVKKVFMCVVISLSNWMLAILVLYLYKKLSDLYKWFIKFDDAVANHLDNICDEVRRQKEIIDKLNWE